MISKLEQGIDEHEINPLVERGKLDTELAEEFRKPENGSHYEKLKKIIGALILAGLVVFSPQKAASMDMGFTEERMNVERILQAKDIKDEDAGLYMRIIDSLKEKGGVQEIQGSDRVYKSKKFATKTRIWSEIVEEKGQIPYYLMPENIFGRDFIQSNPEKAKEWYKKIEPVIKATVRVVDVDWEEKDYIENGFGSGVLISTKKGTRILTNEHVIDGIPEDSIKIDLFGGGEAICKVVARDHLKDLAVLEIIHPFSKEKKLNDFLRAITPLEIEDDDLAGKEGDMVAQIGFPLGFPRETFFNKIGGIERCEIKKGTNLENPNKEVDFLAIASVPDERFRSLAYFETYPLDESAQKTRFKPKGGAWGGMSGGPLINLDNKGTKAKISGIASAGADFFYKATLFSSAKRKIFVANIHAKSINEFLRENGLKD